MGQKFDSMSDKEYLDIKQKRKIEVKLTKDGWSNQEKTQGVFL